MEVNKETESKIAQLQMLEQNIQNFLMQKQTFQTQLIEVDNALEELDKTTGNTYKIVGGIMIATDEETLNMELQGRKEVLGLRIKNIEKQENQLKEKASNLQSEVLKQIKNKEDN